MTKEFKHKFAIQIRFKDVDMMRHVNHADYLSYAELARLKYYDDVLGPNTDWHSQHGLIMARTEVDYKASIGFDDTVIVYTRCSKLGTKSFELTWMITKSQRVAEEIAAEGKTVIVCYDYESKKAVEIPIDKRLKIQKYEGLENK